MSAVTKIDRAFVEVCDSSDVRIDAFKVVRWGGVPVALFRSNNHVYAIDNRCPHMGFPLSKGEVHEEIVVCPWHHWKFDLATGGCFSAGEYDVTCYETRERDGRIWLGPPVQNQTEQLLRRCEDELREGLKSGDPFQIAKAVARFLRAGGEERKIICFAAQQALNLMGSGPGGTWGGLASLANISHLSKRLAGEDRVLGMVQAMQEVSRVIADAPLRRPVRPLEPLHRNDPERIHRLLLYFADKRTSIGVERCLATMASLNLPSQTVAHWIFEALCQHLYPSGGHAHDFVFRCFDLIDQIGGTLDPTILGTLADVIAQAGWAEESEPWAPYVERLFEIRQKLSRSKLGLENGGINTNALGHSLAEGKQHAVLDILEKALDEGASAVELSRALNIAWAIRLARFALVNETDWGQVFHGVIAADSIDQALRRFGCSPGLLASIFDSAVELYLTQSLNIPRVRLPDKDRPRDLPVNDPGLLIREMADGLELRQPDRAGACVAHFLWRDYDADALISSMIAAMFREDGDFHTFQAMRACVNQFEALTDDPDRALTLVGITRMFAAQRMRRNVLMSTQFALKLSKGEYLAGGEE